ncbi:UNVERIFIED_CONTAM: hypothetical protein GTU68_043638 [Idotea baltica]|nr:hypothetical protein [Idotea baltica]
MVRGQKIERALEVLDSADKKTAPVVKKLILSAVANATFDNSVDVDGLFIRRAWVDEGRTLHRNIPRAHGRATPLKKRHSHITVVLDEIGA